jgi:hypothetical protein
VLLVAVLLAACGGGEQLTRREFAREASRICRDANARLARVDVPPFTDHRAAAHALERTSEHARDAIRELHDLRGHTAETTGVGAWLAILDQATDELDLTAAALHAGNERGAIEAAGRAEALDRRGRELGRAYDVSPCRLTGALTTT